MSKTQADPKAPTERTAKASKLDHLVDLLSTAEGASMEQMTGVTGWQPHSVRGAIAGALRKKGFSVESAKVDAARRWRITAGAGQ